MHNGYYTIDDIVELDSTKINTYNPEIVKTLLQGISSPLDLVKKIEKYNDDNELAYNKRLPYSVGIGEARHISVLKAYEISGNTWAFVGWDISGFPGMIYDGTQLKSAMSSISTHIVNVDSIIDVQIGSYDSDKLEDIFDTYTKYEKLTEKDMLGILHELHQSVFSYATAGDYRSAIIKFTSVIKNKGVNDWPLLFKNAVYNEYLKTYEKYINVVTEIVNDVFNPGRITTFNPDNKKIKNKIFVVNDLDDIEKLIELYHSEEKNTETWRINYTDWKRYFTERTFTVAEIENFLHVIGKYKDGVVITADSFIN